MTTSKKYSTEFKSNAISRVLDQHYSRAETSRSLGVNPNLLDRWVKAEHGLAFKGKGKLTLE